MSDHHLRARLRLPWSPRAAAGATLGLLLTAAGCGGARPAAPPSGRVIEIDIDDHGLAGLWMANAPNLKGLIARGTLAFSRVIVPTHSNQNNMALLTGQYPDGDNVPANSWLARDNGFVAPLDLPGLSAGDYAIYADNPLRVRGDSVYGATRRAAGRSAYVGELPPFEVGADDVHLPLVGLIFGPLTITPAVGTSLLTGELGYPKDVVAKYHFDGPPAAGETFTHFTLHDAAQLVRASSASQPMPDFMFVWDFLALDDDPTSTYGADGAALIAIIEGYDDALGDLLSALSEKGLLDSTNILFTLDHGKVDATHQVVLGTQGGGLATPADGQLAAAVTAAGPALGISTDDYAILNEDGDALIYARVPGAGTAAGAARQATVTQALLTIIQSGAIVGLDPARTLTADGALGTRRFQDYRGSSPNQPDILVFPLTTPDVWTLNQVDAVNTQPGPFLEHTQFPYGRHGGFSVDELYVPLIMAGPAFKSGVVLPHPVEHPAVAATAMWALGGVRMQTAARGPIAAAFAGDPGEALPLPTPSASTRDDVLGMSGYAGAPTLAAAPAASAIVIDVAGLYDDEVFADPVLAAAAAPLRALAAQGVRFEDFWTQYRDWPVSEYQFLTGGLPTESPATLTAEDDPAQLLSPGVGLLKMPPAQRFVANSAGYDAWRAPAVFVGGSVFDAAKALGMTTALLGQPDFHRLHLAATNLDSSTFLAPADLAASVAAQLATNPRVLAVVALGGARTGDRHSAAAIAELATLAATVADVAQAAAGALVVITSRGATVIDDPRADFYGAGTSRHVPLVILGPNVRAGVVSGQPGSPADVPATLLFGLGAPTRTDLADGTTGIGVPVDGVPQPAPAGATAGRALVRAFATASALVPPP